MYERVSIITKRVYSPADPADGLRVLVDRLWPRGLSREKAAVDLWLKEIAPDDALRSWFAHRPERWPVFRRRYFKQLEENQEAVRKLIEVVKTNGCLTLLFAASDVARNNAVVVREFLIKRLAEEYKGIKNMEVHHGTAENA